MVQMSTERDKFFSVLEVARIIERTPRRVRQLIETEELKAVTLGRDLMIAESELKTFQKKKRRGPGRPPKNVQH